MSSAPVRSRSTMAWSRSALQYASAPSSHPHSGASTARLAGLRPPLVVHDRRRLVVFTLSAPTIATNLVE